MSGKCTGPKKDFKVPFPKKVKSEDILVFSQTVEYALRAMAFLVSKSIPSSTIPEMASVTHVPAPYLRKVLNRLRDANIIATQRGAGGGITLKADVQTLTILDVINAVDRIERIKQCPLGMPEHFRLCPLHNEIDQTIATVIDQLSRKTFADLIAEGRSADRLTTCEFPCAANHRMVQSLGGVATPALGS
jgi:Rrf2 family transcriptional regulator, nitric oxide-sensitive transcriptional repressor